MDSIKAMGDRMAVGGEAEPGRLAVSEAGGSSAVLSGDELFFFLLRIPISASIIGRSAPGGLSLASIVAR